MRPRQPARGTRRRQPRGPLVVVAGLPGAGKSVALEELRAAGYGGRLALLDSAAVGAWLQHRFTGVPYPLLRPAVHVTHWIRIVVAAWSAQRPLVVHETATRPLSRRLLRALARAGRRPARLVWIDVPGEVAVRGQVARRRVVRWEAFARHLRRVEHRHPVEAAARHGWDAVLRTDRRGAARAVLRACSGSTPVTAGPTHNESFQAHGSGLRG